MAAHIATKYLFPGGCFMFTGAAAIYEELQPEMIGYNSAKTGVHIIARILAESIGIIRQSSEHSPEVIDTPQNKQATPKAESNSCSKLSRIS